MLVHRWANRRALALAFCLFAQACNEPRQTESYTRVTASHSVAIGTDESFRLSPGGLRVHDISVARGQYVRVEVEQLGVDLTVEVHDPQGNLVLKVDGPTGDSGSEEVLWIAEYSGVYHLVVSGIEGSKAVGSYRVHSVAVRTPNSDETHQARAERYFWQGKWLARGGDPAQGVEDLVKAARIWALTGPPEKRAEALYLAGRSLQDTGDITASLVHYENALVVLERCASVQPNDLTLSHLAELSNRLGRIYQDLGNPMAARDFYRRALELYGEMECSCAEVTVLINFAKLAMSQGLTADALDLLLRAKDTATSCAQRTCLADVLDALGALFAANGDGATAVGFHRKAAALIDPDSNAKDWAANRTQLGNALTELLKLEEAIECFRIAIPIYREGGYRAEEAVAWAGVAKAHYLQQRHREALEDYETAMRLLGDYERPDFRTIFLNNIGWLYEEVGEPERALVFLREALNLAQSLGHRQTEASAALGISRVEFQLNHPAEARRAAESALSLVESLRASTAGSGLTVPLLGSRWETYDHLVALLIAQYRAEGQVDPSPASEAFAVSDQGRARALRDSLAAASFSGMARPSTPSTRKLEELRKEIDDHASDWLDPVSEGQQDRSSLEVLLSSYRALRQRAQQMEPWNSSLSPPRPLAIRDLQESLDERTLLLAYHLGRTRSFLWIVSRDDFEVHDLPPAAVLEASATGLHNLLASSFQQTTEIGTPRVAERFSEQILQPLSGWLGPDRPAIDHLIVVPSGALHYLPFAALPEPVRRGPEGAATTQDQPPLGARRDVVQLPAASLLPLLQRRAARRGPWEGTLAAIADPVFGEGDQRLPPAVQKRRRAWGDETAIPLWRLVHSGTEASAVAALLPTEQVAMFTGFDAVKDLLLGGRLSRFRILHIATHGILDPQLPELSALVFSHYNRSGQAIDGVLRGYELGDLELSAELVVLSSCDSALGKPVRGEGLIGLTQEFLKAGAAAVVVSLWKVDDLATSELMEHFYRAMISGGQRPAEALRQAQAQMRVDPRWSAPYYWAGFIVVGAPEGATGLNLPERPASKGEDPGRSRDKQGHYR